MCWGVGGGQGSCGKRCGGRCRKMCWVVGGGKERCVGSGEVWESIWGEEVCWRVEKECGEKNGGGVGKCDWVWGPNTFSTSPPSPHSPHLFLHLPLPPTHPNTLSYTSLSYLFPHLPFLAPQPNTFSYYPHISPHLLKVWRSYHVTKFLRRSY